MIRMRKSRPCCCHFLRLSSVCIHETVSHCLRKTLIYQGMCQARRFSAVRTPPLCPLPAPCWRRAASRGHPRSALSKLTRLKLAGICGSSRPVLRTHSTHRPVRVTLSRRLSCVCLSTRGDARHSRHCFAHISSHMTRIYHLVLKVQRAHYEPSLVMNLSSPGVLFTGHRAARSHSVLDQSALASRRTCTTFHAVFKARGRGTGMPTPDGVAGAA